MLFPRGITFPPLFPNSSHATTTSLELGLRTYRDITFQIFLPATTIFLWREAATQRYRDGFQGLHFSMRQKKRTLFEVGWAVREAFTKEVLLRWNLKFGLQDFSSQGHVHRVLSMLDLARKDRVSFSRGP